MYTHIHVLCILFFYLFLAVLGLQCCMQPSLAVASGESRGYSLVAVCRLLIAVASFVDGARALGHTGFSSFGSLGLEGRLGSCGSQA